MKFKRDCPTNVFKDYWAHTHYDLMDNHSHHLVFCAIGAVMYSNKVGYDYACDSGMVFW